MDRLVYTFTEQLDWTYGQQLTYPQTWESPSHSLSCCPSLWAGVGSPTSCPLLHGLCSLTPSCLLFGAGWDGRDLNSGWGRCSHPSYRFSLPSSLPFQPAIPSYFRQCHSRADGRTGDMFSTLSLLLWVLAFLSPGPQVPFT